MTTVLLWWAGDAAAAVPTWSVSSVPLTGVIAAFRAAPVW